MVGPWDLDDAASFPRILNADHAVFAKLTYEPRQGRDDKVFIETISQKFLFFGSIQHQTLNLSMQPRRGDSM
jgi:hypothetical protein